MYALYQAAKADSAALRATILRVLNNAGINASEQEFQGVSFWRISDGEIAESPAGLYVSILDDHLAISLFPPMAEAELLPAFLGLEIPADSDARARLVQLNEAHAYTPHGSGILDLRRLADQFIRLFGEVVDPVGVIEAVRQRAIGDIEASFYCLRILSTDSTVMVPINNTQAEVRFRHIGI